MKEDNVKLRQTTKKTIDYSPLRRLEEYLQHNGYEVDHPKEGAAHFETVAVDGVALSITMTQDQDGRCILNATAGVTIPAEKEIEILKLINLFNLNFHRSNVAVPSIDPTTKELVFRVLVESVPSDDYFVEKYFEILSSELLTAIDCIKPLLDDASDYAAVERKYLNGFVCD
jgi:hypothetical protein